MKRVCRALRLIDKGEKFMRSFKVAVLGSLVGGSLLLLSAPSQAGHWGSGFNRGTLGNDIRSDRREIQGDRIDLYNDYRDLANDRRDLRQERRDGSNPAEIAGDRQDIRKDRSDIAEDRHDLREERRDLKQDYREHDRLFFSR
jgi:hypothetical protein